jgi:hypothetical protein
MRELIGWARRHRGLTAGILAAGLALAVLGFLWFEPHKLFIDDRVNEDVPGAVATTAGSSPEPAGSPESPAGPEELSRGDFRPLEHDVEGRALVIETADGSRHLRFEDFETSNGPDLVVYLSVLGADQGWYDADDAEFLDLGELKGNVGDQNYELGADVDLSRYRSVVVWCRRFTIGFAVAPISVSG